MEESSGWGYLTSASFQPTYLDILVAGFNFAFDELVHSRNKYRAAKTDSVIDLTQKPTSDKDNGIAVKWIRIKLRELEDEGKECRDKKEGTVNLCAQNN